MHYVHQTALHCLERIKKKKKSLSYYYFLPTTTTAAMIICTGHFFTTKLFLMNCLYFTQILFAHASLRQFRPFALNAANPKKSQENCPQYRNNSRFYFPCAYMPYNNTVLAGPSLSKIIVLKILMNKYFLRTAKKATRGTFWPNSNSSAFSVSLI